MPTATEAAPRMPTAVRSHRAPRPGGFVSPLDDVERIAAQIAKLEDELATANERLDRAMAKARSKGESVRAVAKAANLSHQSVPNRLARRKG